MVISWAHPDYLVCPREPSVLPDFQMDSQTVHPDLLMRQMCSADVKSLSFACHWMQEEGEFFRLPELQLHPLPQNQNSEVSSALKTDAMIEDGL